MRIVHLAMLSVFLIKKPLRTTCQYALSMGMPSRNRLEWMRMCDLLIQRGYLRMEPSLRQRETYVATAEGASFLRRFNASLSDEDRGVLSYRAATMMFRWRNGRCRAYIDPHRYFPGANDRPGDFERIVAPLIRENYMIRYDGTRLQYRVEPARYRAYVERLEAVLTRFSENTENEL